MKRLILFCSILLSSLKSYSQRSNQIDDFFDLDNGDTLFIDVYQVCSRANGEGYRYLIFKESEKSESISFIYIKDYSQTYFFNGKELKGKEKLEFFLTYSESKIKRGKIKQLQSVKEQLQDIIETNNTSGGYSYHCDNFLELNLQKLQFKEQFKYAIGELKIKN